MPNLEASSLGNIRVIPYEKAMPKGGTRQCGGYSSKGQWDGKRYIYVIKQRTYKVARLVCEAFNGKCPAGYVCMHLDENSRNNKPSNLQWGTQKENLNAPGFVAYCRGRLGEDSPVIKGMRKRNK